MNANRHQYPAEETGGMEQPFSVFYQNRWICRIPPIPLFGFALISASLIYVFSGGVATMPEAIVSGNPS